MDDLRMSQLSRRLVPALLCAATCFFAAQSALAQGGYANDPNDPPSRVARIAVAQGNVSLEPAGVDTFSAAELNYPLTAGDRIYADNQSLTELQTGGLGLRLGNGADLTITTLTDAVAQFGLAQGSLRLRSRDLYAPEGQQAVVEVDTPNGTILVRQAGDIRVDSYPQDDTTVVTVTSGAVEVSGQNFDQQLSQGQAIRLAGSDPVYAEYVGTLPPDGLDQFDAERERAHKNSRAFRENYVDPDMIGAADLDQYGDWQPTQEYGAVWYPRSVASGWTPYSVGHWAWVAPWGWTWVDTEPWGFAPFHYGRWNNFGGRWGWVPGPPPSVFRGSEFYGQRAPRPVYSPALVAFVGGGNFSLSISIGGGGGGLTAWFPLGPREAYTPWYHTSPAYVNRVNVTNIYNTNVTEIHNTYINRTTVYNTTNVTYVNRQMATVAVQQRDFAAGHTIQQSQPVRLDANTRQQLAQAPILPHPLVTPTRTMAAPQAPARALPPSTARPVVETRQGFQRAGAPPSATPLRAPVAPAPTSAQQRPQEPARAAAPQQMQQAKPQQQAQSQPVNRAAFPQVRPVTPIAPVTAPAAAPITRAQPAQAAPQPAAKSELRPSINVPARPENAPAQPAAAATPMKVVPMQRPVPIAAPVAIPAAIRPEPRSPEVMRPLQTVTPPQPRQPSFDQQRKAIQQVDPGRPLGPRQVENVNNGRPAGPASQPEAVPHPAPVARPVPPAKAAPVAKDEKPRN